MNFALPPQSPIKRLSWLLWAAAGLSLLALLWWSFAPRPLAVSLGQVTSGRFEQVIEENGQLRLKNRYVISAPAVGQLQRPWLKVGDHVAQNEVIAWLGPMASPMIDPRNLTVLQQRALRDGAALQTASAKLQQLQTALDQATLQARRAEQLAQQNFIAESALDQARLAQRAAEHALEAGQAELSAARFSLAESQAAFAPTAITSLQKLWAVRSPINGQVIKLHLSSAGPVSTGQALLEVGDSTAVEAVIDVLSSDARRIERGAQVKLFLDSRDGMLLGQVTRLEPAAFTKVSALGIEEQRVNVVVEIAPEKTQQQTPQRWGDGFRVEARITQSVAENVLLVPSAALVRDGLEWRIWSVIQGRARPHTVRLKDRNADMAWIEPGAVENGNMVILYPGRLQEGQAVSENPN